MTKRETNIPGVDSDLLHLSMVEALKGLKSRHFSCREYSEALILHSEKLSHLKAYTAYDWEALRRAAKSIDNKGTAGTGLAGIPLVLKDNINTAELTTSAGTPSFFGHVAPCDASVARALFDVGALLGAKGNMHELAFGITSNNAATGAARNPYDASMIPGGSSGGVATAVAARMMPAGVGTDTGASVRLPSALCGIVGFRPTIGRYSGEGIVPISHTRDTAGPMTRNVEDAQLLDYYMAGKTAEKLAGNTPEHASISLKNLRIGVPRSYFYDKLDDCVSKKIEHVLTVLSSAGVELIEADIPSIAQQNDAVSFPVVFYEFMEDLPKYMAINGLSLSMEEVWEKIASSDVKEVFGSQLGDAAIPRAVYLRALEVYRPKLQNSYASYFANHGLSAVIFPTSPILARPVGQDETVIVNGIAVPTFATYIRNTDPSSNAGLPGISIPIALSDTGLPIGMEIDAPAGSDDKLLAIASEIEKLVNFTDKPSVF